MQYIATLFYLAKGHKNCVFKISKWVFKVLTPMVFDRKLNLTLNLSFSENVGVLFYKYVTALWKNPLPNAMKKIIFNKKNSRSAVIVSWIESNNFIFMAISPWFNKLWSFHLLVTSRFTLVSLWKADQNQIIFSMIPKILCFGKKNLFTMTSWSSNILALKERVSNRLRYFRPCRITIFWENKR